jgi:hypothetical protein
MNKEILLFITTIGLIVSGCVTSGNSSGGNNGIPDRIQNPGSEYSESKYLMAVGSGSTLNEARSDAFSCLLQIFQMDINATKQLNTQVIDRSVNNDIYSKSTSRLLNNIKYRTNQELMNTTVLTSEVDKFGTYHAMAGMDRAESSRIYNQEISNNQIIISEFEQNTISEDNILQKLVLLRNTRGVSSANVVLTRQLNVIKDGAVTGGDATSTLTQIQEKFRNTQQKANVSINMVYPTATVQSGVTRAFQQAGFSITEVEKQAMISANANYQTQEANLDRVDAEIVKWDLVIEIEDKQGDLSFMTFIIEGRDGALSYSDALIKSRFYHS